MSRTVAALQGSALLIFLLFAAGCWDHHEPGDLVNALAVGIDLTEAGDYLVFVQLPNPVSSVQASGTAGGGGSGEAVPFIITMSAVGPSPYLALKNLTLSSTRFITLSHVRLLLISERLAKAGIGTIVDLLEREPEMRLSIRAAVVDGDLAQLMKAQLPMESMPAMGLSRMLHLAHIEKAASDDHSYLQEILDLTRPGVEMHMPRIYVEPATGAGQSVAVSVKGVGVFVGEKLVGWLNERETVGWHWVTNALCRTDSRILSPQSGDFLSLQLEQKTGTIVPEIVDGRVRMKIRVIASAVVREVSSPGGNLPDVDVDDAGIVLALRRRVAQSIREDIEAAIRRARELGSDIFGFGYAFYRLKPRVWREIGSRWQELFRNLPIDIDVEVDIIRPGLILSPIGNAVQKTQGRY